MLIRLLTSSLIIFLGLAVLLAFRTWHIRLASRATAASASGRDRPTVLYFRSDACAPCTTQARYLQVLEQQFSGRLVIEKIDADRDRRAADRYGIFTLPTTLIIDRGGQVKHINYGLTAAAKLARQLESEL